MDDRAQIAAMCLQGLLSSASAFCETPEELPNEELVPLAVAIADELLAALKRMPPPALEPDPAPPLTGPGNGEAGEHSSDAGGMVPGGAHNPAVAGSIPAPATSLWDCEARFEHDPVCPGPAVFDPVSKGRFCGLHAQIPEGHRREMHRLHGHRNRQLAPVERLAG